MGPGDRYGPSTSGPTTTTDPIAFGGRPADVMDPPDDTAGYHPAKTDPGHGLARTECNGRPVSFPGADAAPMHPASQESRD